MHRRHFLSYGALAPAAGLLLACGSQEAAKRTTYPPSPSAPSPAEPKASPVDTADQTPTPAPQPAPAPAPAPEIAPASKKEEIFSKAKPGMWAGKEASHAPSFSFSNGKLVITTAHVMDAAHFISSHQVRNVDGRLMGEKILKVGLDVANPSSTHSVDLSLYPHFDIFSRCNLHGLWQTRGAVMDLEDSTKDRILFTTEKPGKWAMKEKTHAPTATIKDGLLLVETAHAMTAEHYISKHQIRSLKGELLGENSFDPAKTTTNPISEFSASILETHAEVLIYSHCNLHGVWKTDFKKPA